MSSVAHSPISVSSRKSDVEVDRSASVAEAIKILLSNLSSAEREAILSEITEYIRPISVNKAGDVLAAIAKILPMKPEWSVEDLKIEVKKVGVEAKPKEVYNAIGYLTRKGHMKRVGYGRYVVDGIEVVTADDLGGAPSRHEDAYRVD